MNIIYEYVKFIPIFKFILCLMFFKCLKKCMKIERNLKILMQIYINMFNLCLI